MKNSILLLLGLGIAVNIFFATPFITYAIPDDGNRGCPEGKVFSSQLNNGRGGCVLAFQPLVGIPFVDTTNPNTSLPQYINALYLASISIAAFLAVIKIIFAGVKYMLSDVVPTKEAAKKDMYGALLGLLIVVGAVLILNTINPQLTGLDALSKIKGVNVGLINDTNDKPVYKYLEICNLYNNTSGLSCQKWCGSKKDGKYDIESKICSHNQPPQTTDDINDTSLVGEDILITGGREQIDRYIKDSGKEVIYQFGPYPTRPDNAHRITQLRKCEEGGGVSYQLFATSLTYSGGSELLVCYK